jgi:hypothetical protein
VPFQSTRLVGDIRRGHYPFKVPKNVSYGNSLGSLGSGWGDVRGHNAIIVVSPSQHANPEGFYQWRRTGQVPNLPKSISDKLPARTGGATSALNLGEARAFLIANDNENYREHLQFRLNYLRENPPQKNNRHTAFQRFLCLVLKDSAVGFYKASEALNETHLLFNALKPESEQTPNEFEAMVYWAMGMVEAMTVAEKALHAYSNAPHLDSQIMEWVKKNAR